VEAPVPRKNGQRGDRTTLRVVTCGWGRDECRRGADCAITGARRYARFGLRRRGREEGGREEREKIAEDRAAGGCRVRRLATRGDLKRVRKRYMLITKPSQLKKGRR